MSALIVWYIAQPLHRIISVSLFTHKRQQSNCILKLQIHRECKRPIRNALDIATIWSIHRFRNFWWLLVWSWPPLVINLPQEQEVHTDGEIVDDSVLSHPAESHHPNTLFIAERCEKYCFGHTVWFTALFLPECFSTTMTERWRKG